jgi:hypothetical protein
LGNWITWRALPRRLEVVAWCCICFPYIDILPAGEL